jgi:hypothetical protein
MPTDHLRPAGGGDVTPSPSLHSLPAFATPEAGFDYFATEAHYRSLAGRIMASLGGFSVVVLTGDPPASAPNLASALSQAAGSRYVVLALPPVPEAGRRDLMHLRRAMSTLPRGCPVTGELPGSPAPAPPLVIFNNADRLSDEQIEEIFKNLDPRTQVADQRIGAAVLLAQPGFLARLERPMLRFWLAKRLLVARLRFQELGTDEIPAFIRHQLSSSEAEGAFTDEAMTAIANVSGGDPTVVNRFSRRLRHVAAAATANGPAQAAVRSATVAPAERQREERGVAIVDKPLPRMRRGGSAALKLSTGTVFCLACLGVAAAWLMHPAEETIAVSGTPITEAAAPASAGGSPTSERMPSAASALAERPWSPAEAAPAEEPAPAGRMQEEEGSSAATPVLAAQPDTTTTPGPAASAVGTMTAAAVPSNAPEASSPISAPVALTPTAPLGQSAAEVAALVQRGDRMFALGDIASARLFYERAADAGDGPAALKLGKTFDPVFLYLAHLYGVRGDAAMAASWYRRGRDLGEGEEK